MSTGFAPAARPSASVPTPDRAGGRCRRGWTCAQPSRRVHQPVPPAAPGQPGRLAGVGRRGVRRGTAPRRADPARASGTPRATGATSWPTSRSRTTRSPPCSTSASSRVKVDREERPDVDAVYMAATQALTGRGGWPMTVFLDPEARPFYAGTYFPPEPRHGMPSFGQLLTAVSDTWTGDRARLTEAADRITAALGQRTSVGAADALDRGGRDVGARLRGHDAGDAVRRGPRRLRRCAQVPAVDGARVAAAPPRPHRRPARPRDGRGHVRGDGARRHVRPARRRLRALLRRRRLGRAALREDALRQRAAAPGLPALVACDRRPARRADRARHGGIPAARHAIPAGRLHLRARRRHRGRGGQGLRLDAAAARRRPRRRRRRVGRRPAGGHRGRHVRARHVGPAAAS